MSMMHAWDQALTAVLPRYYGKPSTPQTMFHIKKEIVALMRDRFKLKISAKEERGVRVEWMEKEQSVNLVVPPQLLTRTLH